MSHILLIRSEPVLPPNLREVFAAPENIIVIRQSPALAKTALERGAFNFAVIYAESGVAVMRKQLQELRSICPEIFTFVLSSDQEPEVETTAYEEGADLYFAEPLPLKSLRRLLAQEFAPVAQPEAAPARQPAEPVVRQPESHGVSTLHTLRDLSHILSYSLDYKAFTRHFILKLRDHISFSRIAIFLESSAKQSLIKSTQSKHLECIASIGLPSDLIDCFQLSRDVGVGREIIQQPRILHKHSAPASAGSVSDASIDKEFSILGCHVAVPISDREGPVGVAVLNGPVTGRAYTDEELELLYVLMEELGLAIHNSRLHSEIAQHGQLIENVLCSMSSGALVCSEQLDVLYANEAAKRYLRSDSMEVDDKIQFAELPAPMASAAHRTVEKGERIEPFQITNSDNGAIYRISIFPFSPREELMLLPQPIMIIIEDYTNIEANQRSAVDHTRSEVITLVAERFAHEIRNSLVPLSTHAQLIDKKIGKPEFQKSLKSSLLKETTRIKRFSEQMLYMAQTTQHGEANVNLPDIIEAAFDRARSHQDDSKCELDIQTEDKELLISGNQEALTYAFEELFINALQAGEPSQTIRITLDANQEGIVRIQIRDGGPGLPDEVIEKAVDPFFTTRNTGIGLGLSVAHKIISEQNGYLRLNKRTFERDWDVEIEIPLLISTSA